MGMRFRFAGDRGRCAAMVAAVAVAAVVTGCAGKDNTPNPTATATTPKSSMTSAVTPSSAAGPTVARTQAEQAALTAVPGGRIVGSESKHEDGRSVWEIEILDAAGVKREVDVDAVTGAVLPGEREGNHDDSGERTSAPPTR